MYLNKAILVGNLTKDPELRALPNGTSTASFSIATNRVWKDKDGSRQEATDYHDVVVFGKQAESVHQYLKKGSSVLVEGRMQTRSWESEGVKKYRTEVVADKVQFGPRPEKKEVEEEPKEKRESAPRVEYPTEDINPDDIPF